MAAPVKVTKLYAAAAVVPHALVSRWSYTVPVGKFFVCELAFGHVLRDAAAAAPTVAGGFVVYTPNGGAASRLINPTLIKGALGDSLTHSWGSELRAQTGDVFECFTIDTCAAGTFSYVFSLIGTQYDA